MRNLAMAAAGVLLATAVTGSSAALPVFPLKPSANNRYLVDQNNVPFLMIGDAPQAMVGNLSVAQAKFFIKDRATYGVNALWVNLLCDSYTACNADGTTFDGIAPFTTPGDLSTPNPAYFDRAEQMIDAAAAKGMVVLLDPDRDRRLARRARCQRRREGAPLWRVSRQALQGPSQHHLDERQRFPELARTRPTTRW